MRIFKTFVAVAIIALITILLSLQGTSPSSVAAFLFDSADPVSDRLIDEPLQTRVSQRESCDLIGSTYTLIGMQIYSHGSELGVIDIGWVRIVAEGRAKSRRSTYRGINALAEWSKPEFAPVTGERGSWIGGSASVARYENGYTEIDELGLNFVVHNGELIIAGRSYPVLGPDVSVVFLDQDGEWLRDVRRPANTLPADPNIYPAICVDP